MVYEEWKRFEGNEIIATSPFSEKVFGFIAEGGLVLDLGCGNGRISKLIKERGYQTHGIDVNANAIASAQENPDLIGITFSTQNAKETNYPDEFFDAVIEQAVLACMEKVDRLFVLNEMLRILKPGGIFSIVEFGIRKDRREKYQIDAPITGEYGTRIVKKDDGSFWYRTHNFNKEELDTLLKSAGFEVVQYTHPDFETLRGNMHPGHQYIVKKV